MSVLERLIAEQNPCQDLQTTQLGVTLEISVLEEVTLNSADISLRGDDVRASVAGRLACRTSDNAVLSGEAAASVQMTASLSLADCSVETFDVALSEFGGEFGAILEALAPLLEVALEQAAHSPILQACRDFGGVAEQRSE